MRWAEIESRHCERELAPIQLEKMMNGPHIWISSPYRNHCRAVVTAKAGAEATGRTARDTRKFNNYVFKQAIDLFQ
jgi:hypothetical protein